MQIDPVPTGPVQTEPRRYVSGPDQHEQLLAVLADAGIELGEYDHRIIEWLTLSPGQAWGTVATIASWVKRAAEPDTDTDRIRETLDSYLEQVDQDDVDTDVLAETIALQLQRRRATT
ncbi:hypothetical protein ABT001_34670 [Streptomyces sp. NPDC002793]|uniref:hypothetical protein n=1 Tax=Streptomyces sp. NPDC002793 TaxID=3154432 RepID=UPI00332E3DFE